MTRIRMIKFTLFLLLAPILGLACNRNASAPPAPLPVEQIPAALQKVFSNAKPEEKDLVNQFVATLQAQDFPKAFYQIQNLASKPELNKEQQSVAARAALTMNTVLQSAEAKGDTAAAQTLKTYRVNK